MYRSRFPTPPSPRGERMRDRTGQRPALTAPSILDPPSSACSHSLLAGRNLKCPRAAQVSRGLALTLANLPIIDRRKGDISCTTQHLWAKEAPNCHIGPAFPCLASFLPPPSPSPSRRTLHPAITSVGLAYQELRWKCFAYFPSASFCLSPRDIQCETSCATLWGPMPSPSHL